MQACNTGYFGRLAMSRCHLTIMWSGDALPVGCGHLAQVSTEHIAYTTCMQVVPGGAFSLLLVGGLAGSVIVDQFIQLLTGVK